MVTNGGFGGVHYALAHDVPLVVAGDTEDKSEIAARVGWAGAGINLRTGTPTPEHIRDAVLTVLGQGPTARGQRRSERTSAARTRSGRSRPRCGGTSWSANLPSGVIADARSCDPLLRPALGGAPRLYAHPITHTRGPRLPEECDAGTATALARAVKTCVTSPPVGSVRVELRSPYTAALSHAAWPDVGAPRYRPPVLDRPDPGDHW